MLSPAGALGLRFGDGVEQWGSFCWEGFGAVWGPKI